jgi:hypothetical protein
MAAPYAAASSDQAHARARPAGERLSRGIKLRGIDAEGSRFETHGQPRIASLFVSHLRGNLVSAHRLRAPHAMPRRRQVAAWDAPLRHLAQRCDCSSDGMSLAVAIRAVVGAHAAQSR